MNWGKWIFVSFVVFAAILCVLVVISIKQDVNLVSKDYYKEELVYQQQIERMKNAASLTDKPEISLQHETLTLSCDYLSQVTQGSINLFRPSNEKLDQHFEFDSVSDSSIHFKVKPLVPGLYRAQFSWEMNNKGYYFEKAIYLN